MMYRYDFEIADLLFAIHIDHEIKITEGFFPFISSSDRKKRIDIWITQTKELLINENESCYDSIVFHVYEINGKYIRIYYDHLNEDKNYAMSRIPDSNREEILYLENGREYFNESHNTFSHIALEELLMLHDAIMIHASFVKWESDGILFAGRSGVGKSTQAELWKKYKKARIINGDKTILRKTENGWSAYGSPYAGSSRYFVNESGKIRTIVLLDKGEECELRKLSVTEALRKIYPHIIVNTWNEEYVKHVLILLEDLLKNVEIYQFACTPDSKAVDVLYRKLKEETEK